MIIAACMVAVVAIAVYAPMLHAWFVADDFAWLDDAAFFCRHPLAIFGRDFGGFVRPVLHATFAADYCLFGEWAPGYYATNIGIHALNAVLLFALIDALGGGAGLAALSALLFALAAPHWRATAWIAARPEGLMTVFGLLTLLAFHRWKVTGSRGWYAAAIGFFLLAMGSKETAVTLAPLLLVMEGVIYRRVTWRAHAPVWILAALLGVAVAVNGRLSTEWAASFSVGPHMLAQMRDALVRIWGPLTAPARYSWLWYVPAVVLIAIGVFGNRWQRFGLIWAVVGALPYSLNRRDPVFLSRYMYFASAGAQMVVAASIVALWRGSRFWAMKGLVTAGAAALLWFHVAAVRPMLADWRGLSERLRYAAEHRPELPPGRRAVALVNLRYGRWYLNHLYGTVPPYVIVDRQGAKPAILVGTSVGSLLGQLERETAPGALSVVQDERAGFPPYRPHRALAR
jgi:hypothetical protein